MEDFFEKIKYYANFLSYLFIIIIFWRKLKKSKGLNFHRLIYKLLLGSSYNFALCLFLPLKPELLIIFSREAKKFCVWKKIKKEQLGSHILINQGFCQPRREESREAEAKAENSIC